MNISRQRIAAVYYGVDRILRPDKKKKKAQQQRNQNEDSLNTGQVVEAAQEKMRMMEKASHRVKEMHSNT